MSRSLWKIGTTTIFLDKKKRQKKLYIWERNTKIPSWLIGYSCFVHTGRFFKRINIYRDKVGFAFGDFCRTRKFNKKKTPKAKNKKL